MRYAIPEVVGDFFAFIIVIGWLGNHSKPSENAAPQGSSSLLSPAVPDKPSPPHLDLNKSTAEKIAIAKDVAKRLVDPKVMTPKVDLENARALLASVPGDDPLKKSATAAAAQLDKAVAKAAADAQKLEQAALVDKRKDMAAELQHRLLMASINADVRAEGSSATVLRVKTITAGAPLAEQLKTDGSFLNSAKEVGFHKIVLDNGFGSTWTFDFDKKR